MASYTLSPIGGAGSQFFDNNGNVLSGGKLYTYLAGTTTPAPTYTTPAGTTANSNPIVFNSAGRPVNETWLSAIYVYKFVLKDANDVLIATYDDIPGLPQPLIVNDASSISYEPNILVNAGSFVVGQTYMIASLGTTDFTAIGAVYNSTGIIFTASGAGSGTGTAYVSTTVETRLRAYEADGGSDYIGFLQSGTGAITTQTVQDKLRETVSVKDFGAVGDGVTDDTVAIQNAVDYCVTNNLNLNIVGKCLITSSINIDRRVNTVAENSWFVVSGGSLYCTTAITMLDTTFDYSSAPQTSQIKFENVIFEVENATTDAYVMSAGYLRTTFDTCSFKKIKLFEDTATWSQSIYLDKCVARAWGGTFFNCPTQTYDLKVFQSMIEASQPTGGNGFNLGTANGCAFTDNVIEGLFGFCIQYKGCNGLSISGNYFEKNTGPEIDGTSSDLSHFCVGVSITGNHFENTGITKSFCIGWSPYIYGATSSGNGATGGTTTLHYLPTPDQGEISVSNDGASAGTVLANIANKSFFVDKQHPAKSGYVYGKSFDGDAASLILGVYYNASNLVDVLELSHLNQANFNGVDFKPSFVNMKANGTTMGGVSIKNVSATNSTGYISFFNSANAAAGSIEQVGATSVAYNTSSDYRLKENVQPMTGALDKVMQLNPVTYTWIQDQKAGQGFIAHELQAIVPDCVTGQKDAVDADGNPKYQGIDTSFLVATLTKAIQELKAEVDALKAK